jgi:protease I
MWARQCSFNWDFSNDLQSGETLKRICRKNANDFVSFYFDHRCSLQSRPIDFIAACNLAFRKSAFARECFWQESSLNNFLWPKLARTSLRKVSTASKLKIMKTNNHILDGKKVAILATDGFEQDELLSPLEALRDAGADAKVVSPSKERKIKGWKFTDWGKKVKVDVPLDEANAGDFDALVLPGGVMNPDHLRRDPQVLEFVKSFFTAGKPVGAICHGPWTLIDAGVVRGRKMTSYETIQTDLKNAGANWVDEEVVVDNGLVTSRKPDDLPAFNAKLIEEIAEGIHQRQAMAT